MSVRLRAPKGAASYAALRLRGGGLSVSPTPLASLAEASMEVRMFVAAGEASAAAPKLPRPKINVHWLGERYLRLPVHVRLTETERVCKRRTMSPLKQQKFESIAGEGAEGTLHIIAGGVA